MSDKKPVPFLTIFGVFLNIGLWSIGGGLSGWAYRVVVQNRKWIEQRDFLVAYGMSQVIPGGNVVNLTVYIGNALRGPLGACVALVALMTGPFFGVLLLQAFYDEISANWWAHAGMDGIVAAAIGLVLFTAWGTVRRAVTGVASLAVLVVTFLAIAVMQWPFIPVVICIAPVSIALAWPRKPRRA